MVPRSSLDPAHLRRRISLAWVLVLALLAQWLVMPHHQVAMATGIAVCSATGDVTRVDANGNPVPESAQSHDCCCPGVGTPPPLVAALVLATPVHAAPVQAQATSAWPAPWLAPLSRGPPSLT